MRLTLDSSHREYFSLSGYLALEGIFEPEFIEMLHREMVSHLDRRSHANGWEERDLWRHSPLFQQFETNRNWVGCLCDLTRKRQLRLAFDHVIRFSRNALRNESMKKGSLFHDLFFQGKSLQELVGIQGLLCAALFSLDPPSDSTNDAEESASDQSQSDPVPHPHPFLQAGDALCLTPTARFAPLVDPSQLAGRSYLLVGFADPISLCVHTKGERYFDKLRALGYDYGDRLIDRHHPVVEKSSRGPLI